VHEPPGLSTPYLFPQGWTEVVYGDKPPVAGGFSKTNPGRLGWKLVGVAFRLVTDGNAANRFVAVTLDDGSGIIYSRNCFAQAVTASTTALLSFQAGRGAADWNANNEASLPLQPVFMAPGHVLAIALTNAQAGDQLDRIAIMFERYPSSSDEYNALLRRQ
jgi:hypothetical protein